MTVIPNKDLHAEVCHCSTCQMWHGSVGMSVNLLEPPTYLQGKDLVKAYQSSPQGQRHFCQNCGTSLAFSAPDFGYYGIAPGVLEDKSGLTLSKEIFVDHKPDYYCFAGKRATMTEAQFLAQFTAPEEETPGK